MRQHINLNKNWKFMEHNITSNNSYTTHYMEGFDDSSWSDVNIPHDNSIVSEFKKENPSGPRGGYALTTMCYYNKHFCLTKEEARKRAILEFEGVYMNSKVYVNGKVLGQYPYGYTAFSYDVSNFVREGENCISVIVDNEVQPGSRWYSGTGIYRPVHLHLTEDIYLKTDDIFITTPVVSQEKAVVEVDFKLYNDFSITKRVNIEIDIMDKGKVVKSQSLDKAVAHNNFGDYKTAITLENPNLWCNANPNLYTAVFKILDNGNLIDEISVRFGVRSIEFSPDQGFIINGKKEMLKGVCIHHDNGCLGAAAYREAFIKKIKIVKEMGANAIRTSHNPEAREFLDLCDEYGMYVMEEAFDEWVAGKRPRIFGDVNIRQRIFSYAQYFKDWAEKDLSAMIRRDRNHPSIVMWSIGNEIEELRHADGEEIAQMLMNVAHKHDKTRPSTAAFNGLAAINKTNNPEILDICGYNYAESFYECDHINNPLRCIVGSETASITAFEERGKYEAFLAENKISEEDMGGEIDPEQLSVNDTLNKFVRARIAKGEESMMQHLKCDYIAGMFIWTGIDYIGEPTPHTWPSISSYFAPIDRAFLPKDAFYFYQSSWSDKDVLHILPHWNFDNLDTVPVWCFTNCEEVELFVNGKSCGKKVLDKAKTLHLEWDNVIYEKGEIKAVGLRNGKTIETVIKTAEAVNNFEFKSENESINAGELFYTDVSLLDENDVFVPNQDIDITFTASGSVSFVACDNGSPKFSDFTANHVQTLSGRAIAVFKAVEVGQGTVVACAEINGVKIEKTINIVVS